MGRLYIFLRCLSEHLQVNHRVVYFTVVSSAVFYTGGTTSAKSYNGVLHRCHNFSQIMKLCRDTDATTSAKSYTVIIHWWHNFSQLIKQCFTLHGATTSANSQNTRLYTLMPQFLPNLLKTVFIHWCHSSHN